VLRGLVIGAAAAALVPLDWYLTRRDAAAQDGENPADKSEHPGCAPEKYDEEANNWPASGPAVCYGGWRRGSYPCSEGYHREGKYDGGDGAYESTRLTTNCHGKNAWRWNGYRCSDAITDVKYNDGNTYRGVTIAACKLPVGNTEANDTKAVDPPPASGTGSRPRKSTEAEDTQAVGPVGALLGRGLGAQ
jgi:hypothetical protein